MSLYFPFDDKEKKKISKREKNAFSAFYFFCLWTNFLPRSKQERSDDDDDDDGDVGGRLESSSSSSSSSTEPARAQIKKRIFSLLIQKDIISSKSRDSHCFYCCACFAFSSWPWCVITVIVARKFFISWHFAQNNRPTGAFFIASKPFCNDNRVSSDCLVIIDARTKHPSRPL